MNLSYVARAAPATSDAPRGDYEAVRPASSVLEPCQLSACGRETLPAAGDFRRTGRPNERPSRITAELVAGHLGDERRGIPMLAVSASTDREEPVPAKAADSGTVKGGVDFSGFRDGDWGSILLRQTCLRLRAANMLEFWRWVARPGWRGR